MKIASALLLSAISFGTAHASSDVEVVSDQGKSLSVSYFDMGGTPQETLTMDIVSAEICGDKTEDISEVELWMPHHGHGSSPTTLSEGEDNCIIVDDIEFTMPGHWELSISYSDEDKAVFNAMIGR